MSTPGTAAPFRPVPKTGVIYVMTEAQKAGYSPSDPRWANLGQGAPETGPLPGSPPRIEHIHIHPDDHEYAPVDGLPELRTAVAELYNARYRQGRASKYTKENVAISPGGRSALTRIVTAWYADRGALTLTHGDPAPSNVLFLPEGGEARLVDFEYGAARHPAYDLAAWDVLCPLPNEFVQGLTREYAAARAALGWPVSTDDDSYVAVVAYRALALLAWLPREARERDCPWVDAWSARQAVLSTLDRLAVRCTGDTALHTLAEAAREASARWRRSWPDVTEVLPPWPALRGALA